MGAKRKDAAKKDEKAEALTNGEEAPAKANGKATKADSAAAATAAGTPNGSKNSKAAKSDAKDAVEAVKESAGKVKAKAADAANAAAAQTAAQVRHVTVASLRWVNALLLCGVSAGCMSRASVVGRAAQCGVADDNELSFAHAIMLNLRQLHLRPYSVLNSVDIPVSCAGQGCGVTGKAAPRRCADADVECS